MSLRNPFSVKTTFVLLLLLAGFAAPASAVISEFSILMNTDVSPASGCDVTTVDGVFPGVEHILITTVDTTGASSAQVIRIERQVCVNPATDTFGPRILVDETDRPVGVGLGIDDYDVVETFFPLSALPVGPPNGPGVVRFGVTSFDATGDQDALLTVSPTGNQPIQLILAALVPTNVPTLSEWGLILLGLLLATAALVILRRRSATALLAALVLLTGAGVAWAVASDLDGNTLGEWAAPLAEDAGGDAPVGADIRAFFAMEDGPTNRIYFRLDVSLEFNTSAVAVDDAATVTEDAAATAIDVLANDTDAESDPFTITAVAQPTNGTVVITGGGTGLTYQPNADYCNNPPGTTLDTFTYTITGGDTATVTVTVTCVPDDPTAVNDAATVAEDSSNNPIDVLANDPDPDGGTKLVTAVDTTGTNGSVSIVPGGTGVTYTPNAGYCNTQPGGTPDTFTYTITGGSTATVSVTVTCLDDPPTAVDDAATVLEDSLNNPIDVLANDPDPDGGTKLVTAVDTTGTNGTVSIVPGDTGVTYTPNASYCNTQPGGTPDTFTYTITGGSTATVTVTVTCVEDDPTAVADEATVTEDSTNNPIDVLANDTDPDGGTKQVTAVDATGTNGTVSIVPGGTGVTYTPNANYCNTQPGGTPDTFTYTLNGGSTATVSVTVTCVEDDPTAVNDAATVTEGSTNNPIDVLANDTDPDGGTKLVTAVDATGTNGSVSIVPGGTGVTYTPNAGYCNTQPGGTPDTFTYTLNGGSTATVSVTVTCVDDPPTAVDDATTVTEDSLNNAIDVLANDPDPDGGPKQVTAVDTTGTNGTVSIAPGGTGVLYTPNADYCNTQPGGTPDTFTYTLNGGSTATVSVTVTCVNDGPIIDLDANDDQGTVGNDFATTFTEGNPATLIEDPLDATVTDVDSATLASLTVTITNLLNPGDETLSADVTGTSITANYDASTGELTLTGPDTVANFQTVLRTVRYLNTNTAPDTSEVRTILFEANDGAASGNTPASRVTVVSVDTLPTAVADAATVNEDSSNNPIDVLANDTDPDGGTKLVTAVNTAGTNGSVAIVPGGTGVTYTPNANYCNTQPGGTPDTFTYTITGGSTATVSVTVTCEDDNPTAVNDAATVTEDSTNNPIDVLANDTDPDGGTKLVTAVNTTGTNGSVAIVPGGTGVTYTPNANYCNTQPGGTPDTFTYTITGGSTATVSVTVTCVEDDPTAVADAATVVEDSTNNLIDVLANDTDPDGGTKQVIAVNTAGTIGSVMNNGTNVTYTPSANYCNTQPGGTPDTFTYTLNGGSTATVSVTVTCVNDPPMITSAAAVSVPENQTAVIDVQSTDPDGTTEGAGLVYSLTGGADQAVFSINPSTGVLTFNSAPNFEIPGDAGGNNVYDVQVTVTDPDTLTGVQNLQVTVTDVPEAPIAGDDAFNTIGNTELRVDLADGTTPNVERTTPPSPPNEGVLDNDVDSDTGQTNTLKVDAITSPACGDTTPPFVCATANGGTVTMEDDGSFSYVPPAGSNANDSFTYRARDVTGLTDTGTVTITIQKMVWYVDNTAGAINTGAGTSTSPFSTLSDGAGNAAPNDAEDASAAGHIIYVYQGNGTDTFQNQGITLKNQQKLWGEQVDLIVDPDDGGPQAAITLLDVPNLPADRSVVTNGTGNAVTVLANTANGSRTGIEIRGLSLASTAAGFNAVDATSADAANLEVRISENTITGAPAEGIDVNAGSTGTATLEVHDNALTATGTALDITRTAGTVVITRFDDNMVSGATGGSGIVVTGPSVTFDATAGGSYNVVNAGATVIGTPGVGNGVGGSGILLNNVAGHLSFATLNIFAEGGTGLQVTGTGAVNSAAGTGTLVTASGGTGIVEATGGPAVDGNNATLDVRLQTLKSTTTSSGVSLVNVFDGTTPAIISAGSGSSINKTGGAGAAFNINGSSAQVTYEGTITNSAGRSVAINGLTDSALFTGNIDENAQGVSLTSSSGSITFRGNLDIATTASSTGFSASNIGTLTVTDDFGAVNTITSSNAPALNVTNTGLSQLEWRSISANGGTNGIVVSNTTGTGGLKVTGTGSAGSGGTIQNTTGDGIALTSTSNVSLSRMNITDAAGHGISGTGVNGFTLSGSNVTGAGDAIGEDGLFFGTLAINNLLGTVTISSSTITGMVGNGIRVENVSGTLNMTVTDTTISNNASITDGILFQADGTANMTLTVGETVGTGCVFTDIDSDAVQALTEGTGSTLSVNVSNCSITNVGGGSAAISVGGTGGSTNTGTFNITGNTISNVTGGPGIAVTSLDDTEFSGFVLNNSVTNTAAEGMFFQADGGPGVLSPILRVAVRGNTVSGQTDIAAVRVRSRDGSGGRLDIQFEGNTISAPADGGFGGSDGVNIRSEDSMTLCLDVQDAAPLGTNNSSAGTNEGGGSGLVGYRVGEAGASTFLIEGLSGGVPAFFSAQSNVGSVAVTGTPTAGACNTP